MASWGSPSGCFAVRRRLAQDPAQRITQGGESDGFREVPVKAGVLVFTDDCGELSLPGLEGWSAVTGHERSQEAGTASISSPLRLWRGRDVPGAMDWIGENLLSPSIQFRPSRSECERAPLGPSAEGHAVRSIYPAPAGSHGDAPGSPGPAPCPHLGAPLPPRRPGAGAAP